MGSERVLRVIECFEIVCVVVDAWKEYGKGQKGELRLDELAEERDSTNKRSCFLRTKDREDSAQATRRRAK